MSDEKKTISNINIGEMLTAAREGKGLSIPTAALHCNLEASIIEKLEANKFSEIGAPVFTRGYLNLYARCLGLNEHEIGEAFNQLKTSPTPGLQISEASAAAQSTSFKRRGTSKWLYFIPLLLLLGWALQQLLSSDSWLITQLNKAFVSVQKDEPEDKGIVLTVGNEQTQSPTTTTVTLSPDNSASETESVEVSNTNGTTTDVSVTTDTTSTNNTETAASETPNNTITLLSATETNNTATPEETPKPVETTPAPEPVVTTSDNEAIQLHFKGGESWIQIDNASKKIVRSGLVKKGETISLPASGAPYSLNVGRPENVELSIYGKQEPLNKFQRSGSPRRFNVSLPNG